MNDEQLLRYSRQINLPSVGYEGQQALLDSHVAIVGTGGLGSPVALYLAAAGVGQVTLIDLDEVDVSNLQRQIAHTNGSIGKSKVESAKQSCLAINPDIVVHAQDTALTASNAETLLAPADVVIDACDNFYARFAINDACAILKKPLVSAAAIRLEGQISVFRHDQDDSPCYRCLYPVGTTETDTCSNAGVFGPVVGIMGSMQALEALKIITGAGQDLSGYLMLFDASTGEWTRLRLKKRSDCSVCGKS